ncbi:MAG: hypothetical protein L0216_06885, partial [Planctomycetales bacterium]|nr:hypothetical protein [Planctomycetales bacterium]
LEPVGPIGTGDEEARAVAAGALQEIAGLAAAAGAAAVPVLARVLDDPDVRVRRSAARGLAAAGAAARPVADRLAARLGGERDVHVRSALAAALGACGGPEHAETLRGLLADSVAPPSERAAALDALGRLGLYTSDGPDGPGLWLDGDPELLAAYARAAARAPPPVAWAILQPLLAHEHYVVRVAAAKAARALASGGAAAPAGAAEGLGALLADPVAAVREAAADSLAALDPEAAARAVEAHLRGAGEVPGRAASVLARLPGGPARRATRTALASPDAAVLWGACAAAAALGDREAAPAVARLLGLPVEAMGKQGRIEAASALASVGGPPEVPALLPLLQDDDLEVQIAAAVSLFRILGAPAEALEKPDRRGPRLAHAMRRWWRENAGRPASEWTRPEVPRVPSN